MKDEGFSSALFHIIILPYCQASCMSIMYKITITIVPHKVISRYVPSSPSLASIKAQIKPIIKSRSTYGTYRKKNSSAYKYTTNKPVVIKKNFKSKFTISFLHISAPQSILYYIQHMTNWGNIPNKLPKIYGSYY